MAEALLMLLPAVAVLALVLAAEPETGLWLTAWRLLLAAAASVLALALLAVTTGAVGAAMAAWWVALFCFPALAVYMAVRSELTKHSTWAILLVLPASLLASALFLVAFSLGVGFGFTDLTYGGGTLKAPG